MFSEQLLSSFFLFFPHPLNSYVIRKRYYQLLLYPHPHWFTSVVSSIIANVCRDAHTGMKMSSIIMIYMCACLHLCRKNSFKNILVVVLIQIHFTSLGFLQSHLSLILHYLKTGISHVTFYNARSTSQMKIGLMQPYGTA